MFKLILFSYIMFLVAVLTDLCRCDCLSLQVTSVPLLKIFTNFQVWNVTIAFTIGLWNLYSSTIAMPQFMKTFMDFDMSEVRLRQMKKRRITKCRIIIIWIAISASFSNRLRKN